MAPAELDRIIVHNTMERNSEELVYSPQSLLDTDLYQVMFILTVRPRQLSARGTQFTIQQAIVHHFPDTRALYRFTNRDTDVLFPRRFVDLLHRSIQRMSYPVMFALQFVKDCQDFGTCV